MADEAKAAPPYPDGSVAEPRVGDREGGAWAGWWPLAFVPALLHLGLALLVFDPTPHTGGDNAAYLTLARALLERGAYLELWDPATPPHTLYPPVFPGILALGLLLGLKPWVGAKLIVVGASVAAVALTGLWVRRRCGPGPALAVAALVAVGPGVLDLSHWVLSDVPFWTLVMLALCASERPERGSGVFVAIAAATLAYFTRSAGLPLVVAVGAWLAIGRRWRWLAGFCLVIVGLGAIWSLRGSAAGGADYVAQFLAVDPYRPELGRIGVGDLVDRVVENGRAYASSHLPFLVLGLEGLVPAVFGALVLVAAAIGLGSRLRRPGVAELLLPLYAAQLLLWPAVWAGERFLLPVLPLILVYAAEAVRSGARRFRPGAARWIGVAVVAVVILAAVPALRVAVGSGMACSAAYRAGDRYPCLSSQWREYFSLAEWAGGGLPADAVVITRKPRLFHALSGLPARIFPFGTDPGELFAAAREAGAGYIVLDRVDGLTSRSLLEVVAQRPDAFCFLRMEPGGTAALLRILPGAGADDRADARDPGGAPEVEVDLCPEAYGSSPVE